MICWDGLELVTELGSGKRSAAWQWERHEKASPHRGAGIRWPGIRLRRSEDSRRDHSARDEGEYVRLEATPFIPSQGRSLICSRRRHGRRRPKPSWRRITDTRQLSLTAGQVVPPCTLTLTGTQSQRAKPCMSFILCVSRGLCTCRGCEWAGREG